MADERCRVCEQHYDPKRYPLCSWCGAFLVDMEELDLSPQAAIGVVFKSKVKLEFLN